MEKRKYKFKIWKYGIGILKQENDYDNTDIMNKIDMLEEKIKKFENKLNDAFKL